MKRLTDKQIINIGLSGEEGCVSILVSDSQLSAAYKLIEDIYDVQDFPGDFGEPYIIAKKVDGGYVLGAQYRYDPFIPNNSDEDIEHWLEEVIR